MKKYFVDTNIFLRLIVNDNSKQHKIAEKIFTDASQNKFEMITSIVIIFEIYWVLTSFYKKGKREATDILENVIKMNFVKIKDRKIIEKAIFYFKRHNLELEDCYNLFYALDKNISNIFTFDRKMEKEFKKLIN